jgi:hypothetical protein
MQGMSLCMERGSIGLSRASSGIGGPIDPQSRTKRLSGEVDGRFATRYVAFRPTRVQSRFGREAGACPKTDNEVVGAWVRTPTFAAVLALMLGLTASAQAATGTGIARAKLEGTTANPHAEGTAIFFVLPRHSSIDLKVRGLSPNRNPIYLAWLIASSGEAHIGGAFARSRHSAFRGGLVVPGPSATSRHSIRTANRLTITKVSRQRAFRLVHKARGSRWSASLPVAGERVVKGRADPLTQF